MIIASQLRAGMAIAFEGQRYKVVTAEYHPGQGKMGGATHARLRNLATGTVWEHSLREGVARFDKDENGGTRIGIRMFYKPPGGVIGHYLAALLGSDAKHDMDDDLVRLKSLIELGRTRAHGIPVHREDLKVEPVPAV
jgi:Elongation factor P (EF-P) KOW-like domain